jgi:LysM repeat protein
MTLPRHDPADAPGPSDEFWGEHTEWTPRPARSIERASLGSLVGRWWDSLLGHGATGERRHGRPTVSPAPSDEYDRSVERSFVGDDVRDLPDEHAGDQHAGDEAWELEPEPHPSRHPGVDPLLARLGGLAVIVTLAAPLVVGFSASGSDSPNADSMRSTMSTAPISEFTDPTTAVVASTAPAPAATDPAAPSGAARSTPDAVASVPVTNTDDPDGDAVPADTSAAASPAMAVALEASTDTEPASTTPASTTPPCGSRYELAAGDYWIRIADAAGVSLAAVLAVNEASIDTVLVPGRSICLPAGAATPAPPPTATPAPAATTPTPAATAPPRRSTPVTTTPPAPTTTAPSRPSAVPPSRAVEIIREVWPDDLEERAIDIAWRESNHRSNVNNYCCYGLFQIHWNAHRSWLSTLGVTSVSQLFDPVVNTNVAYALYQRSGGFGPWGG